MKCKKNKFLELRYKNVKTKKLLYQNVTTNSSSNLFKHEHKDKPVKK